jgi:hypothetical protein
MWCPRLFLYRHLMGLSRKVSGKRSSACDIGTFFHDLHANMYLSKGDWKESESKSRLHLNSALDVLSKEAAESLDGEAEKAIKTMQSDYEKAKVMVKLFWEKYPLDKSLNVAHVEQSMAVRLLSGATLVVKPDLIVKDNKDRTWVEDHKTTTDNIQDAVRSKPWAFQTVLYRIGVETFLETPVAGFLYNFMQVPGIKLCAKDEKEAKAKAITPEAAYLARVKEWYAEDQSTTIQSFWVPVLPSTWFTRPVNDGMR